MITAGNMCPRHKSEFQAVDLKTKNLYCNQCIFEADNMVNLYPLCELVREQKKKFDESYNRFVQAYDNLKKKNRDFIKAQAEAELNNFFSSLENQAEAMIQIAQKKGENSEEIKKIKEKIDQSDVLKRDLIKERGDTKQEFDSLVKDCKYIKIVQNRTKFENSIHNLHRTNENLEQLESKIREDCKEIRFLNYKDDYINSTLEELVKTQVDIGCSQENKPLPSMNQSKVSVAVTSTPPVKVVIPVEPNLPATVAVATVSKIEPIDTGVSKPIIASKVEQNSEISMEPTEVERIEFPSGEIVTKEDSAESTIANSEDKGEDDNGLLTLDEIEGECFQVVDEKDKIQENIDIKPLAEKEPLYDSDFKILKLDKEKKDTQKALKGDIRSYLKDTSTVGQRNNTVNLLQSKQEIPETPKPLTTTPASKPLLSTPSHPSSSGLLSTIFPLPHSSTPTLPKSASPQISLLQQSFVPQATAAQPVSVATATDAGASEVSKDLLDSKTFVVKRLMALLGEGKISRKEFDVYLESVL